MKKILALFLAIIMIMTMTACGGGNAAPQSSPELTPSPNQNQGTTPEITPSPNQNQDTTPETSPNTNPNQGTNPEPTPDPSENLRTVQTRSDTSPREYSFRIYNESDYDIYSIHMGLLEGATEDDIDILDYILVSGDDAVISGSVPGQLASDTEWTLFVTDVDGDTSLFYDVFDPFSLVYVDVIWDYDSGGYRCHFNYGGGNHYPSEEEMTYSFTVYNESDYTIYSIHMGLSEGSIDDDVDILENTLASGARVDISGTIPPGVSTDAEWTLFVTDMDGDTSLQYDVFNPSELVYVDIAWDYDAGGYRCDFVY